MGLTTSVSGCVVGVGLAALMAGCSGRTPVQLPQLPVTSVALAAALRGAATAPIVSSGSGGLHPTVSALTAISQGGETGVTAPVAPLAAKSEGVTSLPVAAAPDEVIVLAPEKAVVEIAPVAVEPEPPLVAFNIPGLTELIAAAPLFTDSFEEGLAAWVTRGLATGAESDNGVVLATGKARHSLWIKTKGEIDLAGSDKPRLKLDFKGRPGALTAVWQTETGDYAEEILLAPIESADRDAAPEFDLADLRARPGHLVLVARAPKDTALAPVLGAVTIYDALEATN